MKIKKKICEKIHKNNLNIVYHWEINIVQYFYFEMITTCGSVSISSWIFAGDSPVLQHISSILYAPVYKRWRLTGACDKQIGYLLMHRIKLCWIPNVTNFLYVINHSVLSVDVSLWERICQDYRSSILLSLGDVRWQSDFSVTPCVIYE